MRNPKPIPLQIQNIPLRTAEARDLQRAFARNLDTCPIDYASLELRALVTTLGTPASATVGLVCPWCAGTGRIQETGLVCRTCGGLGRSV